MKNAKKDVQKTKKQIKEGQQRDANMSYIPVHELSARILDHPSLGFREHKIPVKLGSEWFHELLSFGESIKPQQLKEKVIQAFQHEVSLLTESQKRALSRRVDEIFSQNIAAKQRPCFQLSDETQGNKIVEQKVGGLTYAALKQAPSEGDVAILAVEDRGSNEKTPWAQVLLTLHDLFLITSNNKNFYDTQLASQEFNRFFTDEKPETLDDFIRLVANVLACESRAIDSLMKHGATDEASLNAKENLPIAYRFFMQTLANTEKPIFRGERPSVRSLHNEYHTKIKSVFLERWPQLQRWPAELFEANMGYTADGPAKGLRQHSYPVYRNGGLEMVSYAEAKHDPEGLYRACEYLAEGSWSTQDGLQRYSREQKEVFLTNVQGLLAELPALVKESKNLRSAFKRKQLPALPPAEEWLAFKSAFLEPAARAPLTTDDRVEQVASEESDDTMSSGSLTSEPSTSNPTPESWDTEWSAWMAQVQAALQELQDEGDAEGIEKYRQSLQDTLNSDEPMPDEIRGQIEALLTSTMYTGEYEIPASTEQWGAWQADIIGRMTTAFDALAVDSTDEAARHDLEAARGELSLLYESAPPDFQDFISEWYHKHEL